MQPKRANGILDMAGWAVTFLSLAWALLLLLPDAVRFMRIPQAEIDALARDLRARHGDQAATIADLLKDQALWGGDRVGSGRWWRVGQTLARR